MSYQNMDASAYAWYPCPKCGKKTLVYDGNLVWPQGSSPHRVGASQDAAAIQDIEDIEHIYHCTTCQAQYWSAEDSGSMFHEEGVSGMYYTHAGKVWHRYEPRPDGTYIFTQYQGSLEWVQSYVLTSERTVRLSVSKHDVFRIKGQVQLYIAEFANLSEILARKYDLYRGAYGDTSQFIKPDIEVLFRGAPSSWNKYHCGWEYCQIEVEQDAASTGALAPTRFWAVRVFYKQGKHLRASMDFLAPVETPVLSTHRPQYVLACQEVLDVLYRDGWKPMIKFYKTWCEMELIRKHPDAKILFNAKARGDYDFFKTRPQLIHRVYRDNPLYPCPKCGDYTLAYEGMFATGTSREEGRLPHESATKTLLYTMLPTERCFYYRCGTCQTDFFEYSRGELFRVFDPASQTWYSYAPSNAPLLLWQVYYEEGRLPWPDDDVMEMPGSAPHLTEPQVHEGVTH